MESIGAFVNLLGLIYSTKEAFRIGSTLRKSVEDVPEAAVVFRRFESSMMCLIVLYVDTASDGLVGMLQPEIARYVIGELERIREIQAALESLQKSRDFQKGLSGKPKLDFVARLLAIAEQTEGLLRNLRNIEQTLTLRRVENRLTALFELSGQSASENQMMWRLVRSIEHRLANGGTEEEELKKATDKLREDHPEMSPEEMQKKIEEIRGILRLHFGGHRFQPDPMSFPFIIPVRGTNDVVTRVKLDTGSRPNWINVEVLRKAGLSFKVVENLGQFIGASKTPLPFKPLGQVTVTWFSENQALTTTSEFLVHDGSLPFDVVLGSKWILEDVVYKKLSESLLPLRHIITKEDLQEIETHAREDGASNEQLIELHKQQSKAKRAEKRLLKAASRVTSPRPGGSPFSTGTLAGVSRRDSMVSVAQPFLPTQQTLSPTTAGKTQTSHPDTGAPSTTSSSRTSGVNI